MDRRTFLLAVATGALVTPFAAQAQPARKVYRVGLIFTTSPVSEMEGSEPVHPNARAFVHRLRELGYMDGRSIVIERRSAEGKFERFGDIIADLLRLNVDVMVTVEAEMTRRAARVTKTVPIVFVTSEDPEQAGLVGNMARPGGNVTGLTTIGQEIAGKRLQVLKEAFPAVSRIAYLGLRSNWEGLEGRSLRVAASVVGVTVFLAEHGPTQYEQAFALIRQRADAVIPANNAPNVANRGLIVDFLAQNRLPAIHPYRMFVDAGGLISYGTDLPEVFRGMAEYVARILEGATPGDLPIQQPTKYQLVINLKTAKALGITVPPSLLLRADQVIE